MAISHDRIAINSSTATKVTPDSWAALGPKTNCTLQIQNLGTDAVYVGAIGITSTSYGCAISAGGTLTIDDLPPYDEVYALSHSSTGYVAVLRVTR
jgi:hypothetical protein